MIIKSSQRSGYLELACHLASGENEKVTVIGSRDVLDETILGALELFQATSNGSNCRKHLLHVSVSPSPCIEMSSADWEKTWRVYEEVNKLQKTAYIEIEHFKHGRTHRHRVYERVNAATGKAINLSWTYPKNEKVSRIMEVMLNHPITQGKHNKSVIIYLKKMGLKNVAAKLYAEGISRRNQTVAKYTHSESQMIKQGYNLDIIREHVADAWAQSDSPTSFKAALNDKGYIMADGDKSGTPVIVDSDGHVTPLLRSINIHRKQGGLPTIKKKEFMKKVNYPLPYVDAVREQLDEMKNINNASLDKYTHPRNKPEIKNIIKFELNILSNNSSVKQQRNKKKKLLEESYGQRLYNSDLLRYWKIDRLGNGSIQLKNKTGVIIDSGDSIQVRITENKVTAIKAALQLVKLKGWKEITVTGDDEFKASAYEGAIKVGVKIKIKNKHDSYLFNKAYKSLRSQGLVDPTNTPTLLNTKNTKNINTPPTTSNPYRIK